MFQRHRFTACLFVLVLLTLLVMHTALAASVTVSAPAVEAQAGETVEIPLQLKGAQGLGAIHLELSYDPQVLSAESVTRGALAGSNALLESNLDQPGQVVVGVVSLDGISGDGIIATVQVKAVGVAGASSALTFANNQAWERESHAEVLVNSEAGQVSIAAGLPSWLVPLLAALAVGVVVLILFVFVLSRRRPAPQPAYGPATFAAPPTYAPPPAYPTPPPSQTPTSRGAPPPPTDLPERRAPSSGAATGSAPFQRAEDEYFKLKGQMATGRITHDQFEARLRELMVQDPQGRYWMLGADTGNWYVHDGANWIEGQPY